MHVWCRGRLGPMCCHSVCSEVRGQFCGVVSLLLPWHGFQGANSGHQACTANSKFFTSVNEDSSLCSHSRKLSVLSWTGTQAKPSESPAVWQALFWCFHVLSQSAWCSCSEVTLSSRWRCRRYSSTCSRQARQLGLNRADANSAALAVSIRKYQLPITAIMMCDDDKGCSTIRAYSLSLGVHLESPATFLGSFTRPAVGQEALTDLGWPHFGPQGWVSSALPIISFVNRLARG